MLRPVQPAAPQAVGLSGVSCTNEIIANGDLFFFKYDLVIEAKDIFTEVIPTSVSANGKRSLGHSASASPAVSEEDGVGNVCFWGTSCCRARTRGKQECLLLLSLCVK